MSAKLVLVYALISLSFIYATCGVIENNETSDSDYFGIHVYPQERQCAMLGGMCVHKDDCEPTQLTSTKGLCPNNSGLGVECCYQVLPRSSATCRQFLGECMPSCNDNLVRYEANDCPENTKCCTLV
ncbi:hypothetical protein HA402_003167 [Bradysia odoriphaga]|nr:hypothetical protein HA402_003167 [Bradysia odoriphaga]